MSFPNPFSLLQKQKLLQELYGWRRAGEDKSFEGLLELLGRFGHPHEKLSIIQIAGTNGKGSTAAFLEQILRNAGYRTGFFSSPHLLQINERFQIEGKPVEDHLLFPLLEQVMQEARSLSHRVHFFEVVTVVAILLFLEKKIDVPIFEVGMGGRLDPTTLIPSQLSIITSIALDHQRFLGETLEDITREKAGILRPHTPAVVAPLPEKLKTIIRQIAYLKGSQPLLFADEHFQLIPQKDEHDLHYSFRWARKELSNLTLGLRGHFQRINASLAIMAALLLAERQLQIEDDDIRLGLQNTRWAGRMELLEIQGQRIWLDGAHNPAAIRAFFESLPPHRKYRTILGASRDKDLSEMLSLAFLYSSDIHLCPISQKTTYSANELGKIASNYRLGKKIVITNDLQDAFLKIKDSFHPEEDIVICGSLFLVAEAKTFLASLGEKMS